MKGHRRLPDGRWRVYGRVNGQFFERRFPADTSRQEREEWRDSKREELCQRHERNEADLPPPDTFATDADRYLDAVASMKTFRWRKDDITLWVAVFGARERAKITPTEIRAQLHEWRQKYSASTCNHRRTALMHLYSVLDADTGRPNPVRAVPRFRAPEPEPRGLPPATVAKILRHARPRRETASYARLLVLALTGLPPAVLKRLRPEHWEKRHHRIWVAGREKGKGTRGRFMPLIPEAEGALKLLNQLDAWGEFNTSALNRLFGRAVKASGLPPGPTLYDLRHSFGTTAYKATGDLQAVAELLMHSDTRQTKRYALGAMDARAKVTLRGFRHTIARSNFGKKLVTARKSRKKSG